MAINKVSTPALNSFIKLSPLVRPPDAGATAAMKDLAKNNAGKGSISGQELAAAITAGTKDLDNQAAGSEFAVIKKFVDANGPKLSPEAKKVFDVYKKQVELANANGQTGIDTRSYAKMTAAMNQAAKPAAADVTSGQAMAELLKSNPKDGSITGKEFTDAVVKGTNDRDAQAAGKEFKDIAKFVRENDKKLSPEAKKAFAVYEKAAKEAQANGQTGIADADYNKMVREMAKAGAPAPAPKPEVKPAVITAPVIPSKIDAGAAKALDALGAANPGPGSISGKEMAATIKAATEDLDGQAAGSEFKQIADFVKKNEGKLSPEAKQAFGVYEKAAKAARAKGETGIPTPIFNEMLKAMEAAGQPKYADAGMGAELNKLAAANTSNGSITAKQLSEAVSKGARDLDGNSAGKEFEDLAKFVAENQQLLTPDAKAAFALYEKAAMDARAKGGTSVGSLEQFDKLVKDMSNVKEEGGTAAPTFPGVDASPNQLKDFMSQLQTFFSTLQSVAPTAPAAGSNGANPLLDQALKAKQQLMAPKAPPAGAPPQQQAQYQKDLARFTRLNDLADKVISQVKDLKTPFNPNLLVPAFPPPDATPLQLAQFESDLSKFVAANKAGTSSNATATSSTGSSGATSATPTAGQQSAVNAGSDVADQAIRAIGELKEPALPGPDATPADLAAYEKASKRYDRMLELMTTAIKKRDELQMSIIRKL